MFRDKSDARLLGKGEGVAHGFEHHYKKDRGSNSFLDNVYYFTESFMKRKAYNESRAAKYGKKFGDFADSIAKGVENGKN